MLGLSSIQDRIHTLEQTLHRSDQPLHALPALPPIALPQVPGAGSTLASHAPANAAPAAAAAPDASVVAKLTELSSAFQQIISQEPTIHQYLSRLPALTALLDAHPGSSSLPSSSLLQRQLEVVLSASGSMEHSAQRLEQLATLLPVLDDKWPLDDVAGLEARVAAVQARLPRQAFEAAQTHVQLERYLADYHVLMDFLSRQFLLWHQHLSGLEEQVDRQLAQRGARVQ